MDCAPAQGERQTRGAQGPHNPNHNQGVHTMPHNHPNNQGVHTIYNPAVAGIHHGQQQTLNFAPNLPSNGAQNHNKNGAQNNKNVSQNYKNSAQNYIVDNTRSDVTGSYGAPKEVLRVPNSSHTPYDPVKALAPQRDSPTHETFVDIPLRTDDLQLFDHPDRPPSVSTIISNGSSVSFSTTGVNGHPNGRRNGATSPRHNGTTSPIRATGTKWVPKTFIFSTYYTVVGLSEISQVLI